MKIEVIDYQNKSWTLLINGERCVFIPMSLYEGNNLFPNKPFIASKSTTIQWRVNGGKVSYWQIKKAIKNEKQRS